MIGTSLSPQFAGLPNEFVQGPASNGPFGPPFGIQGSGNFSFGSSDNSGGFMTKGNQFVPELDIGALIRAKERNMNMGLMQHKMQPMKQQHASNLSLNEQECSATSFASKASMPISSSMIDRHLKRSAAESKASDDERSTEQPQTKRQKKSKRPSDMPRRALSAYNIFFSEQRELILKDIEAKESGKTEGSEDLKANEAAEEKPSVLNRTFFPTRAKRAHRKVHGKIGLVQLARTVSQRWKDLSAEKRKVYQNLAEEDRRRHKKVMADYQERKAAENMLSMVAPAQPTEEVVPANNQQIPTEQQMRENMAHQYQQRILAEMLAARQQQSSQHNLSFAPLVNFSGHGNHSNLVRQAEQNMLNNLNARRNQHQSNMWQHMGMGPGMGPM